MTLRKRIEVLEQKAKAAQAEADRQRRLRKVEELEIPFSPLPSPDELFLNLYYFCESHPQYIDHFGEGAYRRGLEVRNRLPAHQTEQLKKTWRTRIELELITWDDLNGPLSKQRAAARKARRFNE